MTTEEQQEITLAARTALKAQLHKYGWSTLPTRDDPAGAVFRADPTAQEAMKAYHKEYGRLERLRHPGKCNEASRKSYSLHREDSLTRNKARYNANPSKAIARVRRWQQNHPKEYALTNRLWYQANPGKVIEIRHRRQARLASAEGEFTEEGFQELCIATDHRCFYCGGSEDKVGPLVPDHMTPVSRGGSNWLDNIVPACRSCNSRKGARTLEEFLTYLAELNEEIENER